MVEELRSLLDKGGSAAIILLDLSTAFDTDDHATLIHRMVKVGVVSPKLALSFLKDRTFQVLDHSWYSQILPCAVGCHSGPPLGRLFNLYLYCLAEIAHSFGLSFVSYAVDTLLPFLARRLTV